MDCHRQPHHRTRLHTATLLPNGKVLVAGGWRQRQFLAARNCTTRPAGRGVPPAASPPHALHTATLLPNGKVLVAGGSNASGVLSSAELYDPASGTWSATGSLTPHANHTATLLPNGKVLVAGGLVDGGALSSAELYDPASGTWTPLAASPPHANHTATLLPNGKVLVAGGMIPAAFLAARNCTTRPAGRGVPRAASPPHALTHGDVAAQRQGAGGRGTDTGGTLSAARNCTTRPAGLGVPRAASPPHAIITRRRCCPTARCWWREDINGGHSCQRGTVRPGQRTWSATGQPQHRTPGTRRRCCPTARCWWQGEVIPTAASRERGTVRPGQRDWSATGSLTTARAFHTATLLPNGKVLVAGGLYGSGYLRSAELYDVGLGFVRPDWQPQIATATSPLVLGTSLVLTGSRFQGISQASGGNVQDSSTNYPVVQLRAIDNSQVAFLPVDPIAGWSDTTFASTPVNNFPSGPALVTIFTNGIPSDSKYVLVMSPAPSPTPTPTATSHRILRQPQRPRRQLTSDAQLPTPPPEQTSNAYCDS